jgi:hypothetical protein
MASGDFRFIINKQQWAALQSAVKDMGKIDGNQAIMNSLAVGMKQLTAKGKTNLNSEGHIKTGNLKRSIGQFRQKKKMSVYGGFKRGPKERGPKERGPKGGNHAHLVDRGTTHRWTKKGYIDRLGRKYRAGLYRGHVSKTSPYSGSEFWTRAVNSEGPKIMDRTMAAISKEIDKIIRRRNKKL